MEKSTIPLISAIIALMANPRERRNTMNETITATLTREQALAILNTLIGVADEYDEPCLENDVETFMKATGLTRKDWEEWL